MSAVIQNEYTQEDTTTVLRNFTFPYLKTSDIKVSLDGVETTAFALANATTIQFNSVPAQNTKIKIFRETSVDSLTATFYAGSAIKSEDLNDNFTQNLYKTQEVGERALNTLGGTMTGDLNIGFQADINFEGTTEDGNDTTLTVVNPTASQTYRLPNNSAGTYNLVSTGDSGTVARGMIEADAIDGTKLADNAVESEHYNDGSIDRVHLAADIVDGTKIADDSINSEHYVADSIDSEHYAPNSVDVHALADNAVTGSKIIADAVDGTKIADSSIDSEHYVDGSIDNEHIADNAIDQDKMADDSIGAAEIIDNAVGSAALASNAVTLAKMDDNSVGTSEIVNDAVTDVKIADNAVTRAKIIADAVDGSKIADDAVNVEHLANDSVRAAQIKDGEVGSAELAASAVIEAKIASDAVTHTKIADNAVTTAKIQDPELTTLAGMQSGTASKLADSTALTADIADLNQIDGLTKQTTISDSDASFPTSGAVVDYVAAQIAPLGGLEVIATEVTFPNTQPASGVVISISDAGGVQFNGSGTSVTARTVGGSTVTINNAPTSLNNETLAAGVGLMVSSTGSGQVYDYHKILGKEDDIKQLSDDINDFNARYRVGSSNPTSALDGGDLFFNTTTGKLLVYNNTNTAWEEAQSIGNFFISTLSPAFDGSTQNFTITNAPTNVQQIILSINGVIQKPNAGTSTPSEGFALDGSTVKLAAAPASGAPYFAVVVGSTVNIGTPSNNTVTTDILQNGSVTTAKIAATAVTQAEIANEAVGQNQLASGAVITGKISDNAVTFPKMQQIGTSVMLGRVDSGTGNVQGLSAANARTVLNVENGATADQTAAEIKTLLNSDGIVNAQIGSSAAIAGSKINPSFGNQAILTTNSITVDGSVGDTIIGSSGAEISFTRAASSNITCSDASGSLVVNTGGSNPRMTINSAGKVGIGTTSPTEQLTLGDGDLKFFHSNAGSAHRTTFIEFGNSSNRITSEANYGPSNSSNYTAGLKFTTKNFNGSSFQTIDALNIKANGNVGIGTTNPGSRLEIRHNTATHGVLAVNRANDDAPALLLGNDSSSNAIISTNNSDLRFGRDVAGTFSERMRMLNGGGLTFNGDTAADNALDDYEEGTWTPNLQFGGSNTGITYSSRYGHYTKIGRQVTVIARLNLSSKGSASGAAKIEGLPFATKSITGTQMSIGSIWFSSGGMSIQGNKNNLYYMVCRTDGNNVTYVEPKNVGYTSEDTVGDSDFGNQGDMTFTITYLT